MITIKNSKNYKLLHLCCVLIIPHNYYLQIYDVDRCSKTFTDKMPNFVVMYRLRDK